MSDSAFAACPRNHYKCYQPHSTLHSRAVVRPLCVADPNGAGFFCTVVPRLAGHYCCSKESGGCEGGDTAAAGVKEPFDLEEGGFSIHFN